MQTLSQLQLYVCVYVIDLFSFITHVNNCSSRLLPLLLQFFLIPNRIVHFWNSEYTVLLPHIISYGI